MIRRNLIAAAIGIAAGCGFVAGGLYGYAWSLDNGPRLIGHGCAGAGGDLWAADESDFPTRCAMIERSR